jgi:hypothetical protein
MINIQDRGIHMKKLAEQLRSMMADICLQGFFRENEDISW